MQHHLVVQDCFNSILRLREARDDLACAIEVHALLSHAIKRMLTAPQALGLQPQDVQDIAFAIAALADEVAMRCCELVADMWQGQPLQTVFFDDHGAGDLFYERLAVILQGPKKEAVLLTYYTALALGFEGRLADSAGRPELMRLTTELRRTLEGPKQVSAYVLSPHALAHRTQPEGRNTLRAPTLALLILCGVVALGLLGLRAVVRARVQQVVQLAQMRLAQEALSPPVPDGAHETRGADAWEAP